MFLNPEFMDSLSKKDRDAIMRVSGEKLSAMAGRTWDEGDTAALVFAKSKGVNVVDNAALAKEFKEDSKGLDQDWINSVEDRKVDAKGALKALRDIAQHYGK